MKTWTTFWLPRGSLALVAVIALAAQAAGQAAPPPDLRVIALRSLKVGRDVRVSGRDIGTRAGSFGAVRDGALWLQGQPADHTVPVAGIDSMWVKSGGHAATGALIGGLMGTVVSLAVISGKSCAFGDRGCLWGLYAESAGITLAGLLVGAMIGSGAKSWQLRYP
ncbi:MAG: hypothetical protein AUH81_10615 [Candidatus Rokubacteria bacterium 13_1_40CM_4_69_5]|nr:MAG: hypothetical protein AUH81_10615 [Candidatus Rokubacteria bacterium 13_1_40CM_4_69_5]